MISIRNRFTRLLHPSTLLTAALLVAGCNAGVAYSLDSYRNVLSYQYTIDRAEWGKFTTDVWGLAPNITGTVLVFYVIGVLASPDTRQSDRTQLRELARKKLGESVLSVDEVSFWTRVMDEVNDGS